MCGWTCWSRSHQRVELPSEPDVHKSTLAASTWEYDVGLVGWAAQVESLGVACHERDPTSASLAHAFGGGDCDGCIQTFGALFMSGAEKQEAVMNSPWAYTHIESLSTGLPALTHLGVEALAGQNARNLTTDFPRAFAAFHLKHLDLIRVRLPHGLAILPILKSLRTVPSLTSLTVPSAEEGDNVKVIEALRALPALKTLHLSLHDPRDSDLQAVSTLSSLTALNLVTPEDVSHQCAPPSSLTAKLLTLPSTGSATRRD